MTNSGDAALPTSLMQGVDAAACRAFGVANLRHRSAVRSLGELAEVDVVKAVFETIEANYLRGAASANKDRSQQNWRWCSIQDRFSEHNKSPEVGLERAIAQICGQSKRDDWANQVPVASGLIVGASDGRRAIDLVHKRAVGHFEFIELKIASDTPVYAAVEIVGYACIWLLAKGDRPSRSTELLEADRVDLRVLAPQAYYERFELGGLEALIDRSVRLLGARQGVSLTFRFDVLDDRLNPPSGLDGEALMSLLAARRPLARPASVG